MNARLIQLLRDLRSRYWFVPGAMVLSALALALATLEVDERIAPDASILWGSSTSSSGARAVLSTLAASRIGVSGVTFSLSIVAVTFATSQYGPHLADAMFRPSLASDRNTVDEAVTLVDATEAAGVLPQDREQLVRRAEKLELELERDTPSICPLHGGLSPHR